MITERFLFSLICFCLSWMLQAQNPSYFTLGRSTLKNAEIYSIHRSVTGVLYVGTNQGLYEYSYGRMQAVPNSSYQKGVGIFNLVGDSKGNVYCSNMDGQIFRVTEEGLNLIYQVPKKYLNVRITMVVDDLDRLLFISRGCISLDYNSKGFLNVKELFFSGNNSFIHHKKDLTGKVKLYTTINDSVIKIMNGLIKQEKTDITERSTFNINEQIIHLNGNIFLQSQLDLFSFERRKNDANQFYDYYQSNESEVWRKGDRSGLQRIVIENGNPLVIDNFFENQFISKIYEDKDGVIYLGTFGSGLLIIPNRNVMSYSLGNCKNANSIAVTSKQKLYISDIVEGIIGYKEKKFTKPFRLKGKVPDRIFTVEGYSKTFNENYPELFLNDEIVSGSIKSIEVIDDSTLLIAHSNGISKFGPHKLINDSVWLRKNKHRALYSLKDFQERCKDAVYDIQNDTLYIATQSSLFFLSNPYKIHEIKLNEQNIIVNDINLENGILWCATQHNGILEIKNGVVINQWTIKNGLGSNFVSKILIKKNKLYVLHKNGFQILDLNTNDWNYLGRAEGFPIDQINDFAIGKDHIWFITSDRLISSSLTTANKNSIPYDVRVDSIKLSNNVISPNQENSFSYNNNELKVILSNINPLIENELQIVYQLKGFDESEKYISIKNASSINYDYLPPGNYSFFAKTLLRGKEKELIEIPFRIYPIYHQQWWFYPLISVLALLGILYLLWRRTKYERHKILVRIKEQKTQMEIAESELRALRSQMNPHFIFNSLTAIQNLILTNRTEESYDYLILFSQLVRNALSYSQKGKISIDEEISFIKTYLELETLRFGEELVYTIKNSTNKSVKIPPLMLQPFIENALIHGLFHKKGLKTLDISLTSENNILTCTISDNGIGRKRASKILNRQNSNHESYSLKSMKRRIEILNLKYNLPLGFTILDKKLNEEIIGTTVKIRLPITYA